MTMNAMNALVFVSLMVHRTFVVGFQSQLINPITHYQGHSLTGMSRKLVKVSSTYLDSLSRQSSDGAEPITNVRDDVWYMKCALLLAESAAAEGEIPVGAILVAPNGTVLARANNKVEGLCDPTAHAEIEAVRMASSMLGTWRLNDCTL